MKKLLTITSVAILLSGCVTKPQPTSEYNILDPFQVASDYLLNSRHYTTKNGNVDFNYREYLIFQKTNSASLFRTEDWEQLIIKMENTVDESEITRRYKLDDTISRTCWAQRNDAQVSVQSNGMRATVKPNYINACVSEELGPNYPLFTYSWTDDPVLGQYLTITKPADHYNDRDYLCKLKREGYHFDMHLYCK